MHSLQQLETTIQEKFGLELADLPFKIIETANEIQLQTPFPSNWLNELSPKHLHWLSKIPSFETQLAGSRLKQISNAIAIVSGKGGVGKSTITCNLAVSSQILGARVGILDADIYGPSIPTMMGLDCPKEPSTTPISGHGIACMSMGLLQQDGPFIWRGPMLAKALMEMINQTTWPQLDYLFIDMPPGTGDIPLSLCQKIPLSGAVIVTTPQTIATLDAEKALQMFQRLNIPILGIIANMAWHQCENCNHESHIFGKDGAKDLAQRYQVPLLGELPLDLKTRHLSDQGLPIACQIQEPHAKRWQTIAVKLSLELAKRPENRSLKIPPVRLLD
jgi:ATP-binding protein involved in chromosome partitioning